MCVCSNKQEDTIMEHTSTICNMIDKPKHLKSAFIHEIEEPATMKMPIWNAQQMAPIKKIEAATKCSNRRYNKPPKAEYTMKTNARVDLGRMKCQPPSWKMPRPAETEDPQ
jgi:hypothetical protein